MYPVNYHINFIIFAYVCYVDSHDKSYLNLVYGTNYILVQYILFLKIC